MNNRFSLLFRLKKPSSQQKEKWLIYLRITIDANRTELSVDRRFDPLRWNKKAGRATGTKEDARALNAYLDTLQVQAFDAQREFITIGEELTIEKLKNKLLGREVHKARMLLDIFSAHNKDMQTLVSSDEYSQGTVTHFETAYKHTQTFIKLKYGLHDIAIDKVDYSFINDFEFYLKSQVCAHNTAMKYLGDLKKIVLLCVNRGWLPKDPFQGYKMSRRDVQRDFLTDEELEAIANRQFATERLTLVRDIFLFSCYTGLAYADVKKLKSSEIRIGIDRKKWLFIKRQKSDTPSTVPLLPVALSMAAKYESHPKCLNSGLVLPILCNQKMNEYLKEISNLCGINKVITYHTARHTFATTVTLNNNVPIESVSKMLGHKSLKQTQHYAKILNKKVGEDMEQLSAKFLEKSALKFV